MKKMRGIAFIGGEGPPASALKEIAGQADILVAADWGLVAAEDAGLTVDWVVGDMDSLGEELGRLDSYPQDRVLRYPPDKDHSDTELALALLRQQGCDEIWLAGGGGGRIDHLFAIRLLFEGDNPPDRWFTAKEEIHCVKEGKTLDMGFPPSSKDRPVSVFPLGAGPWQAESHGLKWPLDGLAWESSSGGLGLSNAAEQGAFQIRSIRGRFLLVMALKKV